MNKKFIYNGTVLTMDDGLPLAENFLIKGGKIVKRNLCEEEIAAFCTDAQWIDLKNKTCLPGLHDSHMHLVEYGYKKKYCVDLSQAKSIPEVVERMRRFIEERRLPKETWVIGMGWNHENFAEKRLLTRQDLDSISTEHYIAAKRVCIHIAVVNSKVLEYSGVGLKGPVRWKDVGVDEDGVPNGLLYENQIYELAFRHVPSPTKTELKALILEVAEELKTWGITTVQADDMNAFPATETKIQILEAYDELRNEKKLPVRICEQVQVASVDMYLQLKETLDKIKEDDMFSHSILKLILDGSLGAYTAGVKTPYLGTTDNYGILNFTDEALEEMISFGYQQKLQIMCHAIGDRTLEQAIRVLKPYCQRYPDALPPRLVHCQVCNQEILQEMAKLHIIADIQPAFALSDMDVVFTKLDKREDLFFYPWKSMLRQGITISGSSDCPVESYLPFYGIFAAVARERFDGTHEGGWLPEEKLSVQEALEAYTTGAAKTIGKGHQIGKIKEGYDGDFTLVSENPLEVSVSALKDVVSIQTISQMDLRKE